MNPIIFIRQLAATVLYILFDIIASIFQFIILVTPVILAFIVTEILDISKDIKIFIFIAGCIAMCFVYGFIKDKGKKIDSGVRIKTKKIVNWVGGKDFLNK